jgi:heme/copper-type cytochrome/quinol oxidase subunit 2
VSLNEVVELQTRTVAATLVWVTVALLIINAYFMSEWIWLISIALLVIAAIVYFLPQSRKRQNPDAKNSALQPKTILSLTIFQ